MPLPSILDCCRVDLLEPEDALLAKYPPAMAQRIVRLREIYNMWLSNPTLKDRQLRDQIMSRFGISQSAAYSDLSVVHQLLPLLSKKSRDYHRIRANEMLLETFNKSKARNDTRSMTAAAAAYAKYNNVDKEDEMSMPYEDIVPQPFRATLDPTVLGIKPIPNINEYIDRLKKDLLPDHPDIQDVEYEEYDLNEDFLFAPLNDETETAG